MQPSGTFVALVEGDLDLALGDRAGRDVEDDRRPVLDRNARGDRVGRKPALASAEGGDQDAAAARVDEVERDLAAHAAAISAQSPIRPRWPEFRSATTATPWRPALAMPSFIASSPITWPKPNWPSTTAIASFSKTIVERLVRQHLARAQPVDIS